LRINN